MHLEVVVTKKGSDFSDDYKDVETSKKAVASEDEMDVDEKSAPKKKPAAKPRAKKAAKAYDGEEKPVATRKPRAARGKAAEKAAAAKEMESEDEEVEKPAPKANKAKAKGKKRGGATQDEEADEVAPDSKKVKTTSRFPLFNIDNSRPNPPAQPAAPLPRRRPPPPSLPSPTP